MGEVKIVIERWPEKMRAFHFSYQSSSTLEHKLCILVRGAAAGVVILTGELQNFDEKEWTTFDNPLRNSKCE